jgi:citrate synthase
MSPGNTTSLRATALHRRRFYTIRRCKLTRGAILADLGMNPAAFNGIFMIARTPGLIAHVIEEQTCEKPMRRIDPVNHGYDGPPARNP